MEQNYSEILEKVPWMLGIIMHKFVLSVYCYIPRKQSWTHRNQPKALISSEVCYVVIATNNYVQNG
jgi:hypothetical protein